MKKVCLIFGAILLAAAVKSKSLGDTVLIYIDSRLEVKIAVNDYNSLKSENQISATLQTFKSILPILSNELSSDLAEIITYQIDGNVVIEPGPQKILFLNKENQLVNTGVRDEAIIYTKGATVLMNTSDITILQDLNVVECIDKVLSILPDKRSWSTNLYYDCTNGEVVELENKINEFDFLELSLGAGGSLIKNQWVPDLSAGIGIGFNKKGKVHFPYISSNILFDFTAEGSTNTNTFLNVGYGWHVSKESKKRDLLSVELGYLISQQGDMFGDNTIRLGVNWSPVKGVFVSPQLYITDNFNSVYPAIRIGFGL